MRAARASAVSRMVCGRCPASGADSTSPWWVKGLAPLGIAVVERARDAGSIRADAAPQDVPITLLMVGTVLEAGHELAPDLWRRYLALILDGLRPAAQSRDPLPPAVPIDVMDRVVDAAHGV